MTKYDMSFEFIEEPSPWLDELAHQLLKAADEGYESAVLIVDGEQYVIPLREETE